MWLVFCTGSLLGADKLPPITQPVMFNTPEADAILGALAVFPPDNPWNQIISQWPVHPNSKQIVGSVGANKPLRSNLDSRTVVQRLKNRNSPDHPLNGACLWHQFNQHGIAALVLYANFQAGGFCMKAC